MKKATRCFGFAVKVGLAAAVMLAAGAIAA
jgi:hypothetical protein